MSKSLERIAKVAGSTALSRVLGLLREVLAARVLGAGAMNSAFLTAFTLPNLFRRFLGEGALTGALVPVLTQRLQSEGREGVCRTVNEVFTWLVVASLVLVVFSWMVAGGLLAVPGMEPRFYDGLRFTLALMPFLVFVCGAAALSACLQVLGNFTTPALAQVWLNLSMIAALNLLGQHLAETDAGRVWWLCGGVLFGGLLQVAAPAVALARIGWRPAWLPRRSPEVREIVLLMGPGVFGAAIYQINLAASRVFAFNLNESAASHINYASRLMELPMGVFALAVTTVVFPLLAAHAVSGNGAAFAGAFRRGILMNAAITLPAGAGLALLAQPIVRLLFEGGAFTAADTEGCAKVLVVFACALPFYAIATLCTRAFHAVKDLRTPVKAATASLVVNLVLSPVLPHWFGTPGLAAASNVAMVVQALMLAHAVRRRFPETRQAALGGGLLKVLAATVVMGVALLACWRQLPRPDLTSKLLSGYEVAVLLPIGVGVYGLAAWMLGIEGVREVAARVLALLGRFTGIVPRRGN